MLKDDFNFKTLKLKKILRSKHIKSINVGFICYAKNIL